MEHELRVYDDLASLSLAAAQYVAARANEVLADSDTFSLALSGGKTPVAMLGDLATMEMDWTRTEIFQVDERVAPEGDDVRNLTHLRQALFSRPARITPMPVNEEDLDEAADHYAQLLPEAFDLVHLGIGPDGHCASLVPDDPVLLVTDRSVALSNTYQGTRRMTLTYPVLKEARQLLWLVSGADKRDALDKLLAEDPSIPAGRVRARASLIMADAAAMG